MLACPLLTHATCQEAPARGHATTHDSLFLSLALYRSVAVSSYLAFSCSLSLASFLSLLISRSLSHKHAKGAPPRRQGTREGNWHQRVERPCGSLSLFLCRSLPLVHALSLSYGRHKPGTRKVLCGFLSPSLSVSPSLLSLSLFLSLCLSLSGEAPGTRKWRRSEARSTARLLKTK